MFSVLLNCFLQHLQQLSLISTLDLVYLLAVDVELKGRHGSNTQVLRELGKLVDIDLEESDVFEFIQLR